MERKSYASLNRASIDDYKGMRKIPIVLVLEDIRSGLNIGSAFRTADGFGIDQIYLCGISATPPNKEILKTALGSTQSVNWGYFESIDVCIQQLKTDDYQSLAVEQVHDAIALDHLQIDTNLKFALIFGNEVNGVSDRALELCHGAIEIPQIGTKHSFNISVSLGIVTWEFYKKFCFILASQ